MTYIQNKSAPSGTMVTDLYTVPAGKHTIISTYNVCNRGSSAGTVRVAFSSGTIQNADYDIYDLIIPPNDSYKATCGFTLNAGTVMKIYASSSNFSFQVYGTEDTV